MGLFKPFVFLLFVFACLIGVSPMQDVRAAVQEIAVVVNDDAISAHDISKRLKLIVASSGLPNTADVRSKLKSQIVDSLINERIMMQEATKEGITVASADVESGFATIAGQNKLKPAKFKEMLRRSGIDFSTMEDQIRSQVAWSKLVQKRLRPRIIVSDRDIDAELERIRAKIGTPEYLAAEIFLPFRDAKQEVDMRKLSRKLVGAVRNKQAGFYKLAQQFSKAAGAAQGGHTGWLHEAQLSPEILVALRSLKKNKVSDPVKTLKGYHIFFLRDTRTLSEETVPSRQQIEYNIGNQRLERLQRRHLSDLRAASFIDVRV